jgi:predicted DNA binding CopG/RHH family protein
MSKERKQKDILEFLDEEERELVESIENEEWVPVTNKTEDIRKARQYAEATFRKDKRMNIYIAERDLRSLKVKALREGIPYPTLVSSILHKYVTGQLVEKGGVTE